MPHNRVLLNLLYVFKGNKFAFFLQVFKEIEKLSFRAEDVGQSESPC